MEDDFTLFSNITNEDNKCQFIDFILGVLERKKREYYKQKESLTILEKQIQILGQIIEHCKKGEFAHVVALKQNLIIKNRDVFEKEIIIKLEHIFSKAEEKCRDISYEYPNLILEECLRNNIEIDESSQHPKYTFYDRFLILEIDEKRFRAKLYTPVNEIFNIPFDIPIVIKHLKEEIERIFFRSLDKKRFLRRIYSCYLKLIKDEQKKIGDYVPIKKITNVINKRSKKNFRFDEFVVDLSKLVEKGENQIEGFRMDLGHTKNPDEGILLYKLDKFGYMGFICFNKVEGSKYDD